MRLNPRRRQRRKKLPRRIKRDVQRYLWQEQRDINSDLRNWGKDLGMRLNFENRTNPQWKTLLKRHFSVEELYRMPLQELGIMANFVLLVDCSLPKNDLCSLLAEEPLTYFFNTKLRKQFKDDPPEVQEAKLQIGVDKLVEQFHRILKNHNLVLGEPLKFEFDYRWRHEMRAYPLYPSKKFETVILR